jgi:hypothetical protein
VRRLDWAAARFPRWKCVMKTGLALAFAISAALAGAGACTREDSSRDSESLEPCPITTEAIQDRILVPSCGLTDCHGSDAPAAELDLVSPGLVERVNGQLGYECEDQLVYAGEPRYSMLYKKVQFDDPGCGSRMPKDLPPLGAWAIGCLSSWIESMPPPQKPEAGAPDAAPEGGSVPDAGSCAEGQVLCGSYCIDDVAPTGQDLHERVFYPSCGQSLSCHNSSNPKEKLLLVTLEDTLAMIDKPSIQRPELDLVEPGHPEHSYLMNKLNGEGMSEKSSTGLTSKQMPRLAPPLCDPFRERVAEWISNGAPSP